MGHMGQLKAEYRDLLTRLDAAPVGLPRPEDAKALQGWREILELFFTPEEAAIAARMPMKPAGPRTLAKRFQTSEAEIEARLEPLCDKGLVMDLVHPETGRKKYLLAPPVVGFFEFSMMRAHDMFPKREVAAAMDAYMKADPAFAREVFDGDTVLGRALVHEDRLAQEVLPDVLAWERATSLVEEAHTLGVSLCYCRHKAEHLGKDCDAPKEICLSLNGAADFVVRRGFGRGVETAEALELLFAAREAGLVQIADNVQSSPAYVCNCCGCCCGQLGAINDWDLAGVNPSGFEPRLDDDRCKGCSRCSRACPITALSMAGRRAPGKRKSDLRPEVDRDRCIGCGVCASSCRQGALEMVRREDRPHVPVNSVEKAVRMALERGRLEHLVFDGGESQTHAFLNRVVGALTRLPIAQKVLASEQVRSRFVRQALGMVRDPLGG